MGKRGRGPADPNGAYGQLAFQKQGYLVTKG